MIQKRYLHHPFWALTFILPQLLITLIFFIWPACTALVQSFFYGDAFGLHRHFAKFANFTDLFWDLSYLKAIWVSLIISLAVTIITMSLGLLMASLVSQRHKSQQAYKLLLIWPYAVAPAVAAILWRFLCHPSLGWLTEVLQCFGIHFDYMNNASQALWLIIFTASWQQFSYNFLFYFAALKALPQSIVEAAIMDGASGFKRLYQIILPLLSPTSFFLVLMNLIYGFFDTFGIIQVITHGGPGNSTMNLIYKVYVDGFEGMDLGSSAAQSVLLMLIVIAVSIFQFKYIEKRVHYE